MFGAPLNQRGQHWPKTSALDISLMTLHARLKDRFLRSPKNAVRPYLTKASMAQSLHSCLDHVNMES